MFNMKRVTFCLVISCCIFAPSLVSAETLVECVQRKKAELMQPRDETKEIGCETSATDCVTGERDNCSNTDCIEALPGFTIVDARLAPVSERGSSNSVNGPNMAFNTDGRAFKVCLTVGAWSDRGRCAGGGATKYNLIAKITKFVSENDIMTLTVQCVQEGAKP